MRDQASVTLAGRNPRALNDLRQQIATDYGLYWETAVADVKSESSVLQLVDSSDDVLLSTVGPFASWGSPAINAAVEAGAVYIDSTGEPAFISRVFEDWNERAQETGARLLTAFGYDYVPGNLAAALAMAASADQGRPADRIEIGYFTPGAMAASRGTRASSIGAALSPSFALRSGRIQAERIGRHLRTFDIDGTHLQAISIGGSEHYSLPRLSSNLTDVSVYIGWAGSRSGTVSRLSGAFESLGKVPGVTRVATSVLNRGFGASGPGESQRSGSGTLVIAEAWHRGQPLERVILTGPSPYDLTADLLAWGALNADKIQGTGALGPSDAFGLETLAQGCARLGLVKRG